jgi:hypothetical protein
MLFSAPMVRALITGAKTQTRRILKPQPIINSAGLLKWETRRDIVQGSADDVAVAQKIWKNDRLWVRENWQGLTFGDFTPTKRQPCEIRYAATDPCADLDADARGYPWRPSIHMPRWASRITLLVTDVRVERLQDISGADAIAEGLKENPAALRSAVEMGCHWGFEGDDRYGSPISAYATLWDHINGDGAWHANPWVVAYTFTVHHHNIDELERKQ